MNQTHAFEYGEAIRVGWELTKTHWRMLLAFVGIIFSLQFVSAVFSGDPQEPSTFGWLVSLVISMIVYVISFAWNRVGIRLAEGKQTQMKDLFWFDFKIVLSFLAGSILFGLIVVAGLLLLIIPGIIFALMFGQYALVIADKGLGPIAALKESKRLTDGQKWRLFGWGFVQALVMLGGLLLFIVGVFLTMPVVMMAQFYIYTKLRDNRFATLSTNEQTTNSAHDLTNI